MQPEITIKQIEDMIENLTLNKKMFLEQLITAKELKDKYIDILSNELLTCLGIEDDEITLHIKRGMSPEVK